MKTKESGTSYRIGKIVEALREEYLDLTASTLRFWERQKLLVPSLATVGGQRRYTQSDLYRVRIIKELSRSGLSLDEISTWFQKHSRELADQERSPIYSLILPWSVQIIRRRIELEAETRKFLALDEDQRRSPIHPKEALLLSAGGVTTSPKIQFHFKNPLERHRASPLEILGIEKVKGVLFSQLRAFGVLCPARNRNRQKKEMLLYSETDRLIFTLAFFLGKEGTDLKLLKQACSFFEAFGTYPQLPWRDAQGHMTLANVLFNLVVDQGMERTETGGAFIKFIKDYRDREETSAKKSQSQPGFLSDLDEMLRGTFLQGGSHEAAASDR